MEKLRVITLKRLKELKNPKKQIAFAYSACFRMLPNYQYFSRNYAWGNEYCMIEGLDVIRSFILTDSSEFDRSNLLSNVDTNIPNSDNFSTAFSTYAQNAASAIYYTLNNLLNVDLDELSWVPVLSRDTVDAFVQEIEGFEYDGQFEHKILNHWMMKRELQKQEFDFLLLQNHISIDEHVLKTLTVFNDGKSNIDI